MKQVGIRELKQNASAVIREVLEHGPVAITVNGDEVAFVAPLPASPLERLRAYGHIRPAVLPLSELPPPEELPGVPPTALSDTLREMREDEESWP